MFTYHALHESGFLRNLQDPDAVVLVRREFKRGDRICNGFDSFVDSFEFLEYKEELENPHMYTHHEIFYGELKPFADLDGPKGDRVTELGVGKAFLQACKDKLREFYDYEVGDRDVVWCSSSADDKLSSHIIIDKVCFADPNELRFFMLQVREAMPPQYRPFLDMGPFARFKQLRILGECKQGTARVKVHLKDLCMWAPRDSSMPPNRAIMEAAMVTATGHCKRLKRRIQQTHDDVDHYCPDDKVMQWVLRNTIPDYCEVGKVTGSMVTLIRQSPSQCNVCGVIHSAEHPYLFVTRDHKVFLDCRRSEVHRGKREYYLVTVVPPQDEEIDLFDGDDNFEAAMVAEVVKYDVKETTNFDVEDNFEAAMVAEVAKYDDNEVPAAAVPMYLQKRRKVEKRTHPSCLDSPKDYTDVVDYLTK